jgi:hypothetical protein
VGIAWVAVRSLRPVGPGNVFEATLVPGGITREGGEIQTITIPAGTDTLRLRLVLPREEYQEYEINLLDSADNCLLQRDHLTASSVSGQKFLNLDISSTLIKRDTYQIKLSARTSGPYEPVATYNFRINHT